MGLEFVVPSVHSVDLVGVLSLSGTSWKVPFCPFSESGGNLFGAYRRVFAVVSVPNVINIPAFSVSWSTMGEVFVIVVPAPLVATLGVSFHSSRISLEFSLPGFLGRQPSVPIVQKFGGEFDQPVQTLERVSWWYLFLLSGDGGNDCDGKFHVFTCFGDFMTLIEFLIIFTTKNGLFKHWEKRRRWFWWRNIFNFHGKDFLRWSKGDNRTAFLHNFNF